MKPESVELRIEELVLHGFEPVGDHHQIGEAVQRELSRLFVWQGTRSVAQGREVALVDGGAFEVASDSTVEAVGVQVAQAVYKGLNR